VKIAINRGNLGVKAIRFNSTRFEPIKFEVTKFAQTEFKSTRQTLNGRKLNSIATLGRFHPHKNDKTKKHFENHAHREHDE